mmetsp:Transcript_76953/g.249330  ORF Transcript_76953/g.249330 Transcript_76953/m.249330 type:complete len:188 (-) Transcript_76953:44-607(-)
MLVQGCFCLTACITLGAMQLFSRARDLTELSLTSNDTLLFEIPIMSALNTCIDINFVNEQEVMCLLGMRGQLLGHRPISAGEELLLPSPKGTPTHRTSSISMAFKNMESSKRMKHLHSSMHERSASDTVEVATCMDAIIEAERASTAIEKLLGMHIHASTKPKMVMIIGAAADTSFWEISHTILTRE